jgi:hypothetical protein
MACSSDLKFSLAPFAPCGKREEEEEPRVAKLLQAALYRNTLCSGPPRASSRSGLAQRGSDRAPTLLLVLVLVALVLVALVALALVVVASL